MPTNRTISWNFLTRSRGRASLERGAPADAGRSTVDGVAMRSPGTHKELDAQGCSDGCQDHSVDDPSSNRRMSETAAPPSTAGTGRRWCDASNNRHDQSGQLQEVFNDDSPTKVDCWI
jgi:hypothetical protein